MPILTLFCGLFFLFGPLFAVKTFVKTAFYASVIAAISILFNGNIIALNSKLNMTGVAFFRISGYVLFEL
jgi:hypothetical protein